VAQEPLAQGGHVEVTGMLHGAQLLHFVRFPATEVLGPAASEAQVKDLIDRHGEVFIKPVFKGGIGKKGKAGLLGRARDLKTALAEKERLYFVEHRVGNLSAKANGVTFEAGVPAAHEVYFSITDSTRFRAPTMTLTHRGGVDIEEIDKRYIAQVPFDPLTGLKAFVVAHALSEIEAPPEIISPLVQQLPKLWELFHNFGMTTLELNPIRLRADDKGRLTPVACDFKGGFDRDDTRWLRLQLPAHVFAADYSDFEQEINQLRTHQGQSDVYVINAGGTVLAPTFGGGANSLVTELLGDDAIISSDFGGNPPYDKMKRVARVCFKHWLTQANVLFVIGGKSNNTDIHETLRAIADALREHFSAHGASPLYVVIGRGGPNLVRGLAAMRDACEALGLPYRLFGFDSDISEVIQYARRVDAWMKSGGREQIAARLAVPGSSLL
jgi:succinyl-CoA synthetase beta subunit